MRTEEIRKAAIQSHHREAGKFVDWYNTLGRSHYANAFAYGRSKIDAVIDELFAELPKESKILDVGCGTGEHLQRAAKADLKPHGIEPAPAMLAIARDKVPSAEILEGVATELPFSDEEFDLVIMVEVLRYLDRSDIEKALAEARRVLKPEGQLFVTLVNRWALDGFYLLQRARALAKGKAFDEKNPYCLFHTPSSAERDLNRAGFCEVRIEGRMMAPLRIAYKLSEPLGARLARWLEPFDDRIHQQRWTRPFAGHLIVIGRVGRMAAEASTEAARRQ